MFNERTTFRMFSERKENWFNESCVAYESWQTYSRAKPYAWVWGEFCSRSVPSLLSICTSLRKMKSSLAMQVPDWNSIILLEGASGHIQKNESFMVHCGHYSKTSQGKLGCIFLFGLRAFYYSYRIYRTYSTVEKFISIYREKSNRFLILLIYIR